MRYDKRDAFKDTKNPVVVIEDGIPVTLNPSQEIVATGTVQVATNSEVSTDAVDPRAAAITTHIIK